MRVRSLGTGRFVAKLKDGAAALLVVNELQEYYIPQLKFRMKKSRECAYEMDSKSDYFHGEANALEVAIGCIEEAIELAMERPCLPKIDKSEKQRVLTHKNEEQPK